MTESKKQITRAEVEKIRLKHGILAKFLRRTMIGKKLFKVRKRKSKAFLNWPLQ